LRSTSAGDQPATNSHPFGPAIRSAVASNSALSAILAVSRLLRWRHPTQHSVVRLVVLPTSLASNLRGGGLGMHAMWQTACYRAVPEVASSV
jgi:hypothetical protein